MAVRQTRSYLQQLFARHGIAPRHRLGQNFLVDLNIHDLIVETAGVGPDDLILEVGTGAGALTTLMAGKGAAIVAVELDPAMARLTREAVAELPRVQVLNIDALASKSTLGPELLATLQSSLQSQPDLVFKLVANLPYHVATPIIANLLTSPELSPALMVVTIQRELADRMTAPPSSPAYGALSVLVQALAEVSLVRILPPSVFWPRPKVESAVVSIRPDLSRKRTMDIAWFHQIVRKVFLHRRQNLRRVLAGLWPEEWTKSEVDLDLQSLGIDGQLRAEALEVRQFEALALALKKRFGNVAARTSGDQPELEDESAKT